MPLLRRTLIASSVLLATAAFAQSTIKVEGAWARPTVAGQAGGGGFLTITAGSTADRLLSASATVSKVVELHSMDMEGNVMRMRQVEGIDIPAGQTVQLKPGGLHVMFVGLNQTLKKGATIPVTLRFAKAGEVKVNMKVMNAPEAAGHEHGAKDGHKH
jgi:periplasmic copper chaperone A